ncbi:hypothetical protein GDO86_002707, partial [Hymenochirus boettgeri]
MAAQMSEGIRLSALNPKFLHTNSTSHTWPFSAVAELIDNAYDPDVNAKQIWIDKTILKNDLCLTFTDSGNGMTLDKLYKMLSFGFSDKVTVHGHVPVGLYGNGFKSGSMRLGKDAIVFTKNESGMHVGMLSQSYLESIHAEHVIVPIISFNKHKQMIQTEDSEANLLAITTHSLLRSPKELLAELDAITTRKGTRIIIWNLRRDKVGCTEFDFEHDKYDILIPAEIDGLKKGYKKQERLDQIAPDSDFSLRAYCSILYLKPRMQIILRGQKVQTQLVSKSLALIEKDVYRPSFLTPKTIKITFGYNCRNKEHYGIMMYHKNRLIKAYVRVGCQLKANNMGVGVVGVIECNFLKPTHNKQDFDYTNEYRLTLAAVGQKLNDYWNEMKVKKNSLSLPVEDIQKKPDQNWVQCDACLKWRKVPDAIGKLPEKWYCNMNTDPQFRNCCVPEEPEDDDDITHSTYEKTYKRRKSEQIQQVALDKPTILFTPPSKDLQPAAPRFFPVNNTQGSESSTSNSCKRPQTKGNTSPSSKKQRLCESDTIDLLECEEDNDGDVIIVEGNSTPKPKNESSRHKWHKDNSENTDRGGSSGSSDFNGGTVTEFAPVSGVVAVATQTERPDLTIKKEEEGNNLSCQHDDHHFVNHNGNSECEANPAEKVDEEKKQMRQYCKELRLRVTGLEEEVVEMRNKQVKIEVSHQETQVDVGPLKPSEMPSTQLVAKYNLALIEIKQLKDQCGALQDLKLEQPTASEKKDNSEVDEMALQLDGVFRKLEASSNERDRYKKEAEALKQRTSQLESQNKKLETQMEHLKRMVQEMSKKEASSFKALDEA